MRQSARFCLIAVVLAVWIAVSSTAQAATALSTNNVIINLGSFGQQGAGVTRIEVHAQQWGVINGVFVPNTPITISRISQPTLTNNPGAYAVITNLICGVDYSISFGGYSVWTTNFLIPGFVTPDGNGNVNAGNWVGVYIPGLPFAWTTPYFTNYLVGLGATNTMPTNGAALTVIGQTLFWGTNYVGTFSGNGSTLTGFTSGQIGPALTDGTISPIFSKLTYHNGYYGDLNNDGSWYSKYGKYDTYLVYQHLLNLGIGYGDIAQDGGWTSLYFSGPLHGNADTATMAYSVAIAGATTNHISILTINGNYSISSADFGATVTSNLVVRVNTGNGSNVIMTVTNNVPAYPMVWMVENAPTVSSNANLVVLTNYPGSTFVVPLVNNTYAYTSSITMGAYAGHMLRLTTLNATNTLIQPAIRTKQQVNDDAANWTGMTNKATDSLTVNGSPVVTTTSGNAVSATTANNFSGSLGGDVTGTQAATVVMASIPRQGGTNSFTGTNDFTGTVHIGALVATNLWLPPNVVTNTSASSVILNYATNNTDIGGSNNLFSGTSYGNTFMGAIGSKASGNANNNSILVTNQYSAEEFSGEANLNVVYDSGGGNFFGQWANHNVVSNGGSANYFADSSDHNVANGGNGNLFLGSHATASGNRNILMGTNTIVFTGRDTLAGGHVSSDLAPSTGYLGANVVGAVPSATTATSFSGTLSGDVTGTQGATVVSANFPRLNAANVFTANQSVNGSLMTTNITPFAGHTNIIATLPNGIETSLDLSGIGGGAGGFITNNIFSMLFKNFYFCSPTGNDANDGTNQPWATGAHNLPAGSSIYLMPGTYASVFTNRNITIVADDSAFYRAYAPNATNYYIGGNVIFGDPITGAVCFSNSTSISRNCVTWSVNPPSATTNTPFLSGMWYGKCCITNDSPIGMSTFSFQSDGTGTNYLFIKSQFINEVTDANFINNETDVGNYAINLISDFANYNESFPGSISGTSPYISQSLISSKLVNITPVTGLPMITESPTKWAVSDTIGSVNLSPNTTLTMVSLPNFDAIFPVSAQIAGGYTVNGNYASTGTNAFACPASGYTNILGYNLQLSVTAGTSMALKNTTGGLILTPVINGAYIIKPYWRFTGTLVTATLQQMP